MTKSWIIGFLSLVLALGLMPFAQAAGSATFTISPVDKTVAVGDRFDLSIYLQPDGENVDTARAIVSFPVEQLQVENFRLGDALSRVAPGNKIDNEVGELSQGAFTLEGPINESGLFGTITFKAIAAGPAQITISDRSRIISAGTEKINASLLGSANITIGEATVEEEGELAVSSLSHPDENAWYANSEVEVSWSGEAGSYRIAFDQSPETDPTEFLGGSVKTRTFTGTADGVWYIHLKAQQSDGTFTKTIHQKVQIDRTSPRELAPNLDESQLVDGQRTYLRFATTDDTSGIDHYEISINKSEFIKDYSPVILEDFGPGDYFIEVKAIDKAGNATYGITTLRIYEKGTYPELEERETQADKDVREASEQAAQAEKQNNVGTIVAVVVVALALLIAFARRKKTMKQ